MTTSYLDEEYLQDKGLPQASPHVTQLEDMYLNTLTREGDPAKQAQLYDRRPDWYKQFAGSTAPPVNSAVVDAGSAIADAASQAQAEKAAYYERAGFDPSAVMRAQKKASMLGIGGKLLDALGGKKSRDFDTQQARAAREAQMSTLGKAGGAGGLTPNEILGGLNYFKTKLRNDQLWQLNVDKAKRVFAEADKDSPESRDAQAVLVRAGLLKPEEAGQFSFTQAKEGKTALMQRESEDFHAQEFDRQSDRKEAEDLGKEERAQLAKVDEERRKEELTQRQAYIPGWKWANDTPPSVEEVVKVKQAVADRELMVSGSRELQQIQQELEDANGAAAAAGTTLLRVLGDDRSKELLSRAKRLTHEMNIAARRLGQMGVPQLFEQQMVQSVNPDAGDIGTYFKGAFDWKATEDFYTNEVKKQLNLRGAYEEGDESRPVSERKPAEQAIRTHAKPPVRRAGQPASELQPVTTTPGQAAGLQSAAPAGPRAGVKAPAGTIGWFQLKTARGTTTAYPLNQKRWEQAVKEYGAQNVIKVQ